MQKISVGAGRAPSPETSTSEAVTKLNEIIERLEKATEGSPELDEAIFEAVFGNDPLASPGKRYSSSLDAAISLVPSGNYWISVQEELTEEPMKTWMKWFRRCGLHATPKRVLRRLFNHPWKVSGGPGGRPALWEWWQASVDLGTETGMERHHGHSEGGTPALALCIAALRARANRDTPSSPEETEASQAKPPHNTVED